MSGAAEQLTLFDLDICAGRMYQDHSVQRAAKISASSSRRLSGIKDGSCSVPRPDSGRWESAGAIILGNQFSLAWRVMDAQFWGVAQRRKRIFLVADFAGRSAPQILFGAKPPAWVFCVERRPEARNCRLSSGML